MKKQILPVLLAVFLGVQTAPAQDLMDTSFSLGAGGTYDNQTPSNLSSQERFRFDLTSPVFALHGGLTANGDQVYGPDIANFNGNNKTLFNNYYFIDDGYTVLTAIPRVTLTAGRFEQKDQVDSPYSLFFSSKDIAASGAQIKYEDDRFLYEDRWLSLDSRSSFADSQTPPAWANSGGNGYNLDGFPDRGTDVKSFIYKTGTMRFGFQDSVVYAGRSFDPNYFFDPVPQYFTQYFYAMGGRPWSTNWTDKYAMGGFWTWKEDQFDTVVQVLVNDFSLHFLFPSQVPNNPWKVAWDLGGSVKTEWGKFGFYHAGALKYTFEPITAGGGNSIQNAVGMTYIPDVEFFANGSFQDLQVEDNSIGYLHGENNLAFMVTWDYGWTRDLTSRMTLEYLVAGNNSPANPWQDANSSSSVNGTQLLGDPLLEQRITWTTRWDWKTGPWAWFAESTLGVRFNPLTLENPDLPAGALGTWEPMDTLIQIYKPQAGIAGIFRLSIGGSYTFGGQDTGK